MGVRPGDPELEGVDSNSRADLSRGRRGVAGEATTSLAVMLLGGGGPHFLEPRHPLRLLFFVLWLLAAAILRKWFESNNE